MTVRSFVEPGWTVAVAAVNRPELRIVFYPDGSRRFWHRCMVPDADPDVPIEDHLIECAPVLQHDVGMGWDGRRPEVSVHPSILCLRCRLHGFFVANEWRDA